MSNPFVASIKGPKLAHKLARVGCYVALVCNTYLVCSCVLCSSLALCNDFAAPKFKPACFDFSSSNFNVQVT
jgi:hypothetical protein